MINSHRIEPKAAAPDSNLRRVRKGEATAAKLVATMDGLELCLACWKDWMGRNDTDLGVKSQSTLMADSDGYGSNDTSQMRRDNEIAEATDAMIRSLQRSHQWAIRIQMGVAGMKVWTFRLARSALETLLKKNIATRLLFS
jgi:5'-deoxynucleotidase YfbR-like HD superfamily hydrolase